MSSQLRPRPGGVLRIPGFANTSAPLVELTGAAALFLAYAALWLQRTRYDGLGDDAHLYALQALAHLQPANLSRDVFLAFGSQDQFTIFSPLYASLIKCFGLVQAAALGTALCHAVILASAWYAARLLGTLATAALSLGLIIVVPTAYGGGEAFQYREGFMTARLPAEAAVCLALCGWLRGRCWLATLAVGTAALLHPLMALPALFAGALGYLISTTGRKRLLFLLCALTALLGGALLFARSDAFAPVSPEWLSIIRARSPYLFLSHWTAEDWGTNLLPLASLMFTAFALKGTFARRLAWLGAATGASGLLLAWIAADVFPVQLVLQLQTWRWIWLAKLLALLLVPVSVLSAWTEGHAARCSALLAAAAWIVFPVTGVVLSLVACAVFVWRASISQRAATLLGALACVAVLATLLTTAIPLLSVSSTRMEHSWLVERAQDLFDTVSCSTAIVFGLWYATSLRANIVAIVATVALTTIICISRGPRAYEMWTRDPLPQAALDTFASWRNIIPPGANVLWLENPEGVWFLLNRASYMSQSQSAGVVFSEATAREIDRRTNHLSPLVDRAWLLGVQDSPSGDRAVRPLTRAMLTHLCTDSELDFVVSGSEMATAVSTISQPGPWRGLRLYACRSRTAN